MFPVLVDFGPVAIRTLGIAILLGWVAFSFALWHHLNDHGIDEETIFDLTFKASIIGFLAARLGYVAIHFNEFTGSILSVAAIWVAPGLSFTSGMVAGVIVLLLNARRHRIRMGIMLDGIASGLFPASVIGLIGVFFDGATQGMVTSLPWGLRPEPGQDAVHPVVLYEIAAVSVAGVAMYLMKTRIRKKLVSAGMAGIVFFLMFAMTRFLAGFLIVSRVRLWELTPAQWVYMAVFAESVGALYVRTGGFRHTKIGIHTARVRIVSHLRRLYERSRQRIARKRSDHA